MIIIEGCDNTGKSTLIAQLQEEFRIPAIRSGMRAPPYKQMQDFHYWLEASPTPIILDRHPIISDYVYGRVIRNSTEATLSAASRLTRDHYLIFCHPPLEVVANSIGERDQMEGVSTQLTEIYQLYSRVMDILNPNQIYDYTKPNALKALITNLTHYLAKHEN